MTHSLYILDPDGNEIELYIDVRRGRLAESDPSPGHAAARSARTGAVAGSADTG